jgi:hypothetical protein
VKGFSSSKRKEKKISLPTLVHYLPTSLRRNKRSGHRNRADLKLWKHQHSVLKAADVSPGSPGGRGTTLSRHQQRASTSRRCCHWIPGGLRVNKSERACGTGWQFLLKMACLAVLFWPRKTQKKKKLIKEMCAIRVICHEESQRGDEEESQRRWGRGRVTEGMRKRKSHREDEEERKSHREDEDEEESQRGWGRGRVTEKMRKRKSHREDEEESQRGWGRVTEGMRKR